MIRLKELRLSKGYKTQKEFAEAINVSKSTYNYWENEKIEIDYASLKMLADFFNVTIDYLLGRDNPEVLYIPENMRNIPLAFHNGIEDLTQEDIDDVSKYIEFIKNRKKNRTWQTLSYSLW